MHLNPCLTATFLCAALAIRATCALPIATNSMIELAPRVAVRDACISTIPRAASTHGDVAKACIDSIAQHVLFGGSSNVLNHRGGAHLASAFLPSFPGPLSKINDKALIVKPAQSDGTKTLWLDDGLLRLLTTAQEAQEVRQKAVAALQKTQTQIKTQKEANDNSKTKVEPNKVKAVKVLQNIAKKQQDAVDKAALKPKDEAIIELAQSVDFVARKGELYTQTIIKAMCADAMKQSLGGSQGRLLPGDFIVSAPNLRSGVTTLTVRLLQGVETGGLGRPSINTCFPVLS